MTSEQVPTRLLEAGDVIHICHHHNSQCGGCLAGWETDAVVTEKPAPVGGRIAVKWANARLPGAGAAITGINVFSPGEQVLRIGRLPVRTRPVRTRPPVATVARVLAGIRRLVGAVKFADQRPGISSGHLGDGTDVAPGVKAAAAR